MAVARSSEADSHPARWPRVIAIDGLDGFEEVVAAVA
jgi:hypothetical protein